MDMVTDSPVVAVTAGNMGLDATESDPKCPAFFDWLEGLADGDRCVALFRWMRSEEHLSLDYIVGLFELDGDDGIALARNLLDGIARRSVDVIGVFAPFMVSDENAVWWIGFPGAVVANDDKPQA